MLDATNFLCLRRSPLGLLCAFGFCELAYFLLRNWEEKSAIGMRTRTTFNLAGSPHGFWQSVVGIHISQCVQRFSYNSYEVSEPSGDPFSAF